MVGKRGSPVMRRTTSMTGITVDVVNDGGREPSDLETKWLINVTEFKAANNGSYGHDHQHVSPSRNHHRSSSEGLQMETAHFLRNCGLCNGHLAPRRDIYMYRGDTAFCSMDCREQQIKNDKRKEKSKLILQKKIENHHSHSELLPSDNSENYSKSGTIAAA